jgi:hypothetical protein
MQLVDRNKTITREYVIKFVSDLGQVGGFLRALRFLHQLNLPLRYNWNIVESGVKHHKTNQPIIMYLQRNHNWVVVWLVLTCFNFYFYFRFFIIILTTQ